VAPFGAAPARWRRPLGLSQRLGFFGGVRQHSCPFDDEGVDLQRAAATGGRASEVLAPPFVTEGVSGVAARAVHDQALAEVDGGNDQPGPLRVLAAGHARQGQVEVVLQAKYPGVERGIAVAVLNPADVSGLAL
jgi:hypothetical protein